MKPEDNYKFFYTLHGVYILKVWRLVKVPVNR